MHVVGHAGQALALPDQLVLLLLPLLHLRVQVGGQQPQLQTQLGDAGLLLVEDRRRQEPALAPLSFLCSTLDTILLPGRSEKKKKKNPFPTDAFNDTNMSSVSPATRAFPQTHVLRHVAPDVSGLRARLVPLHPA